MNIQGTGRTYGFCLYGFWGQVTVPPLHVAKPHIISGSNIMGFSPHHLPMANIIPPPTVVRKKPESTVESVSEHIPPCGHT